MNVEAEFDQKVQEILALVDTCRYLAAHKAHDQLLERITTQNISEDARDGMLSTLSAHPIIQQMLERSAMVRHSLHSVDESDDWILGAEMYGITTQYKKCEDDENAIVVKVEGTMDDLPFFEQMAVLHEIDLYTEWVPFCTDSVLIDKVGKAELYAYLSLGLPLFSRDFLFHAFGADCMQEQGKVVILGKSVESHPTKEVPFKKTGWRHRRMSIQDMEAIVEALTPTAAKTKMVLRVDLNAALPHSLINSLTRKLAGVILYVMQRQVMKIVTDRHCQHAQRIRSNCAFYRDWLLPKLRHYCDLRRWRQPVIPSLGDDGIPQTQSQTETETETAASADPKLAGGGESPVAGGAEGGVAEHKSNGAAGGMPGMAAEPQSDDGAAALATATAGVHPPVG